MTGNRRLVADCGGLIDDIALTLPRRLLTPEHQGKAKVLGRLAEAMPAGVAICLMTDDPDAPEFRSFLQGLTLSCTLHVVASGIDAPVLESEIWTQDSFMVFETEGALHLAHLTRSDRLGRQARWLAASRDLIIETPDLHLAGGNTLTGEGFRLVGAQSLALTRRSGGHPIDADAASHLHAAFDPRPLHVFGFALPGGGALLQQPHHIDLVVSLTGLTSSAGLPIVLVADPRKTLDRTGPRMEGWAEQIDASVARLEADGFHVIRNAVPYVAHRTYAPNPTLRAYNNVIVENAVRPGRTRPLVWLPHFADLEPDLATYDALNRRVWEDLGFTPMPVHGCSALVRSGGAIRCASKVLKRKMVRAAEPTGPRIRNQGTLETIV